MVENQVFGRAEGGVNGLCSQSSTLRIFPFYFKTSFNFYFWLTFLRYVYASSLSYPLALFLE